MYSHKSNKVAKIQPLNQYVFVETKALYDNDTYIMQTIEPVLDSQKNVILVPSFNEETSKYYDFDDIFETEPISVEIVKPEVKVVNDKTYDSGTYANATISREFMPHVSKYIVFNPVGNIFLFCDASGVPFIDLLGYFIPVITPLCSEGSQMFWTSMNSRKNVELLGTYTNTLLLDDMFRVGNQLTTSYYSRYNPSISFGPAPADSSSASSDIVLPTTQSGGASIIPNMDKLLAQLESSLQPLSSQPPSSQPPSSQLSSVNQNTFLFTNKESLPILANKNKYILASDISGLSLLTPTVPYKSDITISTLDVNALQNTINSNKTLNKIDIYIQNTDILINNYIDISGNLNNLNTLKTSLMDLRKNINEETLTSANTIYSNVLSTYKNLESYTSTREITRLEAMDLDRIKNTRQNELTQINNMISSLQRNFNSLQSKLTPLNDTGLNSDYTTLYSTYTSLKASYDAVNTNIEGMANITALHKQEQNIAVLFNSVQILQKNVSSFEQTILQRQKDLDSSLLNTKRAELQTLVNTLDSQQSILDDYKQQRDILIPQSTRLEGLNNQFNTYVQNIQTILDTVKEDKNTIVETVDSIDVKITNYQTYIQNIETYKNSLKTLLTNMKGQLQNSGKIDELKATILKKIRDFEERHAFIMTIFDRVKLQDKDSLLSELRGNYIEIQTTETSVPTTDDLDTLDITSSRVDELVTIEQDIQNRIQVQIQQQIDAMELEQQKTPAPSPASPQQLGGKKAKKWQTRKANKSKSKSKQTTKSK